MKKMRIMILAVGMIFLFAVGMIFLLAGCVNSDKENARKTAEDYFAAIQKGSWEEAEALCISDVKSDFQFKEYKTGFQEEFQQMGLNKELMKKADGFIDDCMKESIESYKAGKEEEQEDSENTYLIPVSLQYKEISELDFTAGEIAAKDKLNRYIEENDDALQKIYAQKGQKALQTKILEDTLDFVLDEYRQLVKNQKAEEREAKVFVTKKEDEWLISKIIME